ncbi:VCBS repeat-containing protein [Propioniciclava coleopterorum]|uniref:VCBS repeat-containing protein n=1 Tax=Propioniciclava coleopterorum TaxID=2714937 RepID=A0A6G7YAP4_9ACTN|nr:VCBS repeat-containing protein [Propioniciclava coleopterorum]QIK73708.1 VCBS repeat-containing protein [Propioniciclava coleopterorum]
MRPTLTRLRHRAIAAGLAVVLAAGLALTAPTDAHAAITGAPNKLDLLAVRGDGDLLLYRNTGSVSAPYSGGSVQLGHGWDGFGTVVAGDFDGDGRSDVFAAPPVVDSTVNQDARVYVNTWSGSGPLASTVRASIPAGTRLVAAGDLNGDGVDDLLRVSADGRLFVELSSLAEPGNGTFGGFGAPVGHGWGSFKEISLADMNRDGFADIIGRRDDGALWLYLNRGAGAWGTIPTSIVGPGRQIGWGWDGMRTIVVGDTTGDGWPDVLAVRDDGVLLSYTNSRSVTHPYSASRQVGHGWGGFSKLMLADFHTARATSLSIGPSDIDSYQGPAGVMTTVNGAQALRFSSNGIGWTSLAGGTPTTRWRSSCGRTSDAAWRPA